MIPKINAFRLADKNNTQKSMHVATVTDGFASISFTSNDLKKYYFALDKLRKGFEIVVFAKPSQLFFFNTHRLSSSWFEYTTRTVCSETK